MKERIPTDGGPPLCHNPFAKLGPELGPVKGAARVVPEPVPVGSDLPAVTAGPPWAVVRLERKGRGGKEVTVVDKLELGTRLLDVWLVALKQALGCGGAREGAVLVLQGDQRKRAASWLIARGVRKVTQG